MGIFEYACPRGHVTERHVNHYDRPTSIPCTTPNCTETAAHVLSATPTTLRVNDRKAFKGRNK